MNKKKILGMLYPIFILLFMLTVYYCLIVNLVYLNGSTVFANPIMTTITVIYLCTFHILLAIIVYCDLYCMFSNPGEPPQFWVSLQGLQ